jgi:hypothetical protein
MSKRVILPGPLDTDPAITIIQNDSAPAIRIQHQGTGKALEVVSSDGTVTWSVDKSGGAAGIDQGFAGFFATDPFANSTVGGLTANRGYIVRFVAPKSQTITKMSFVVTTAAGANDNCDVGIFNSGCTTLLGSAGSTAGKLNGLGAQTVNLAAPVAVVAGTVYYAAFSSGAQGGTAASLAMSTLAGSANIATVFGTSAGLVLQNFNNAQFPLAAPFTIGGPITSVPLLALVQ